MKTNREKLLEQIEMVLPGISQREIIEQSSCVIFKDNRITTYNDEVSCSSKSCLDIECAVPAMPLVSLLRKLPEETLSIEIKEGELFIKGKSRRSGIKIEQEILLPIDSVEKPKKWKPLPDDFTEAIKLVQECAGKDETMFILTCVHITPKWIEACNNHQAARYKIKIDIEEPILIRKESLKNIISLNMTEFSITKTWAHFKNPDGLVLSCRKFVEKYESLGKFFKRTGEPITLPKGLKEAADKAQIFSAEDADSNEVEISIENNKIRIKGNGVSGWFTETKKIKYKGGSQKFTISPILLSNLVENHNACEIAEGIIKVSSGKFNYVASLGKVENNE